MKVLLILTLFLVISRVAVAGDPAFTNAPPQASVFGPIIGDHSCEMTYQGVDGVMDQVTNCRWKWYYKFDGHMVQDDFWMLDSEGNTVWTGSTLRTFDFAKMQWNNMFLGAHDQGFGKMYHGKGVGDEIHMTVDGEDPDGRKHLNRIFFYDIEGGKFKWRQERSYDEGETWVLYVRTIVGAPETE